MNKPLTDRDTCLTEGKEQTEQSTMVTQSYVRADFIGLRTAPVILTNGGRSLKINALLDDASTKTYVNADVAAELGLQGRTEKVTVNVLNGQAESFNTKPVSVELKSVTGSLSLIVNAYTVDRVTGNMHVVDWNKYKKQWPHLRNIDFPSSTRRPIVDMLIGLDCADLLYAIEEVRGRPGEPISRLTPLGWSCIGKPFLNDRPVMQTNFAYTYLLRDQSVIEKQNGCDKEFFEMEQMSPLDEQQLQIDQKLELKNVQQNIQYEHQIYQVSIPCKVNESTLADDYEIA